MSNLKEEHFPHKEQTSPLNCKHHNLKLEQTHPDYLTGWYICVECGERFKTV